MPSQVQLVRDLWRAYESGGLDAFFAAAGDDVVWQPFITGNRVFRGTAELREELTALAAQGIRYEPQLHDLEQHGNVVLVHGVLRVSNNGRFDETPLHWAYHFRDGRLQRQSTHTSREAALETLSALRLLDDVTFSLAEAAGSDGERVIRLRGELDIESAPDLERVLLRSRPPASAWCSTSPISSSWTRPDCACSCERERPPRRAAGRSACATCRRPSAACST